MSFLRAAHAAPTGPHCLRQMLTAVTAVIVLVLAGLSLSCGSSKSSSPSHLAYVTLPSKGNVLLLQINGATGAISTGAETPQVQGTSPTGLALTPSKQFLYVANSRANTISIFSVANSGTLSLIGTPIQAGNGPDEAIIDPSGQYLLVTNNYGNNPSGGDISVYSIAAGSGALTEVPGSPFAANANPTQIVFTHSGQFVYVTNPGIGMVSGFSFNSANGTLTQLNSSPVPSGKGASDLVVDASDQFLYVVNPAASNPPPYQATTGNVSAFSIVPGTGALTTIPGSPFTVTNGTGPSAIAIDPTGRFVYAVSAGSSFAIWCFAITPTNGELAAVTGSPFSLGAGGLFALFDPSGDFFYIGSATGNGIQGYTYNPSTGVLHAISGSPFSVETTPGAMVLSE
jgi:6-phosphogluconolactonase